MTSFVIKWFTDAGPKDVIQETVINAENYTAALEEFIVQTNHDTDIHVSEIYLQPSVTPE